MAKYRLDTMLTGETLDKLIELAKKEKRSKSAMAAFLIEKSLSLSPFACYHVYGDWHDVNLRTCKSCGHVQRFGP